MKYYGKEMPTIHPEGCTAMTWEDAEAMNKLNQENGWGFSMPDLLRLLADHMEAYDFGYNGIPEEEAKRTQEKIEWRLEDANFHKLCALLHDNDYVKASEAITEEISNNMDYLNEEGEN